MKIIIYFKHLAICCLLFINCSFLYSQSGWISQSVSSNIFLYGVHFVNSNTGWTSGLWGSYPNLKGIILKTTNGGTNWNTQVNDIVTLTSVYFTDANTGCAVGDSGRIFKTTNGGNNWSIIPSGTNKYLNCIFFIDNSTGWSAGYTGTILKTTNGGNNWIAQSSGLSVSFNSISFVDYNTGWISSSSNIILKTTKLLSKNVKKKTKMERKKRIIIRDNFLV